MNFAEIRTLIPDFGRDIRLNLETILSDEGAPGLSQLQIWGTALASAYSIGSIPVIGAILNESDLDVSVVEGAKAAATIMAMNNIYYRATHLMGDGELKKLPARLRMNVIGKPGIPKIDFELMCFAVSALSGCGQCLTSHLMELRKGGVSDEGAQSALRIASVVSATHAALKIGETVR